MFKYNSDVTLDYFTLSDLIIDLFYSSEPLNTYDQSPVRLCVSPSPIGKHILKL